MEDGGGGVGRGGGSGIEWRILGEDAGGKGMEGR